jgi:hypothetical protein
MKWFKFYGQDYLTDTKIISMDPILRVIWITMLCLADDKGEIKHLREWDLIKMAGCDDDQLNDPSDLNRSKGCLNYFEEAGMITMQIENVKNSNATVTDPRYAVTLTNFSRRQSEFLSNAERQKRFRENHKTEAKNGEKESNKSNVTPRYDSNARTDKNRLDKNKENYVKEIPTLSGSEPGGIKKLQNTIKNLGLKRIKN